MVFKAKNRETQEIVALKRVRLDDEDDVTKQHQYQTKLIHILTFDLRYRAYRVLL